MSQRRHSALSVCGIKINKQTIGNQASVSRALHKYVPVIRLQRLHAKLTHKSTDKKIWRRYIRVSYAKRCIYTCIYTHTPTPECQAIDALPSSRPQAPKQSNISFLAILSCNFLPHTSDTPRRPVKEHFYHAFPLRTWLKRSAREARRLIQPIEINRCIIILFKRLKTMHCLSWKTMSTVQC